MTWLRVDLPEPFGPMMACTSPGFTVSESPWRISRSSTRTCRFLTSSSDIHSILLVILRCELCDALHRILRQASKDELWFSEPSFEACFASTLGMTTSYP